MAKLSKSSREWLKRQERDPYVKQAKKDGYKSRAAYKLIEIDDRFKVLKPGKIVVDLGAAPGGWTQIAVERVRPLEKGGKVIGIDLLPMDPIAGAELLQGDFYDAGVLTALEAQCGGEVDVVLSDMAPSTTGHKQTDHIRIMALFELAWDFADKHLAPGGAFVAKVFQGGTETEFLKKLKQNFETVKHMKPPASRKESAEIYVVALKKR
jgi:23S rRNA (uridine2552-2'-O)-methyltransferase